MAFCGEYVLEQLEGSIAALRLAASEPQFVNMRVISTNIEGVSEIEVLQRDLPFSSPLFTKTKVFDHPDIEKVEFRHWPNPHFHIIGTVQGVKSAMLRRYAYFIQREAVSFFKMVSADSLISRKGSHLLPGLWECAKLQAKQAQLPKTTEHRYVQSLKTIPLAFQSPAARALGPDVTLPPLTELEPIPQVSFRKYDKATDKHISICRPKTPTPKTNIKDFFKLPTDPDSDPTDTLPYIVDDWDSTDDDQVPDIATITAPTTPIPPNTPPIDRLALTSPPHPVGPLPVTDDDWD
jgi:hypothetical protein